MLVTAWRALALGAVQDAIVECGLAKLALGLFAHSPSRFGSGDENSPVSRE